MQNLLFQSRQFFLRSLVVLLALTLMLIPQSARAQESEQVQRIGKVLTGLNLPNIQIERNILTGAGLEELTAISRSQPIAPSGLETTIRVTIGENAADVQQRFEQIYPQYLVENSLSHLKGEPFTVGTGLRAILRTSKLLWLNTLGYAGLDAYGIFLCGNTYIFVREFRSAGKAFNQMDASEQNSVTTRLSADASSVTRERMQRLAGALQSENACAPATGRLPIIFLPGVAGSELLSGSSQVWPLAPIGNRADLALEANGMTSALGATINVGDLLRASPINFYGEMVDYLKTKGYQLGVDLFLFPYDWRLDNREHLDALDRKVNEGQIKSDGKKVVLLAHSMGGVIARAYIYSDSSRAAKVDALVTMGTPYWGAPKVYYGVLNGYQFGNPTVRQPLMKILTQNMPAAYQLIPWVPFVLDATSGKFLTLDETYAVRYKWFKDASNVNISGNLSLRDQYRSTEDNVAFMNKGLLESAKTFRALVGSKHQAKPLPAGVKQYAIIGYGVRTLGYYRLSDWQPGLVFSSSYLELSDGRKVVMEPRFVDGDGTVPLWSLESSATTLNYYVLHQDGNSAGHGDLAKNTTVQSIVGQLADKKPPDPSRYAHAEPKDYTELEGGMLSFATGLGYSVDFTLHSDAHLRIVDTITNSALGLNEREEIEESLATGTFLSADGVEYASFADSTKNYRIVVTGLADGKFSLNVDLHHGAVTTAFVYSEIPVKPGTVAQFTFKPAVIGATLPDMQVSSGGQTTRVSAKVAGQVTGNTAAQPPTAMPIANDTVVLAGGACIGLGVLGLGGAGIVVIRESRRRLTRPLDLPEQGRPSTLPRSDAERKPTDLPR